MGRAPKLSLHERYQIKALSTAGHSVKQISDVVKRSRKALMNFLRHEEEYGTKKSSGRSESMAWRMLSKFPNIVRSRMKKCPQLTQGHNGVRFTFQQDNATIHASRSTKTRLEYNDVNIPDWLWHSQNLNSMENP
uniref:HTH_Tnp_Tc3_1 domain-containing protein n=1 Tax=Heterorhabditis bacteriophora TaxID=37862 RepID=A0A1I7WS62_HETBA